MALPVVLVFCMALLIFGSFYLKSIENARPLNDRLLERVQADFLGHGIMQMALLKFKQFPSEFQFAYRAVVMQRRVLSPDPWVTFVSPPLQGAINTPYIATYSTSFALLGQDQFNTDTFQVTVTVNLRGVQRKVNHTVSAIRVRN